MILNPDTYLLDLASMGEDHQERGDTIFAEEVFL